MQKTTIKIAHSPDSDDAFMFYALKFGKITSQKYDFDITREDIEVLNQQAKKQIYDISAISIHAYAHLSDKYALLSSGASMAENDYGPMVIAKKNYSVDDLPRIKVAIPGEWTTACLILKILCPNLNYTVLPFEQIMPAVIADKVDAGLIIHEGQLQYENFELKQVVNLIDIWKSFTKNAGFENLPLPLGGNAVKKSLGSQIMSELSEIQKQSIQYAMDHHADARNYAMQFKRDLSAQEADKYLSWYANERTLDYGTEGRQAIQLLFDLAHEKNLLKNKVNIEII